RSADALFQSQMALARGYYYLYKIEKKWEPNPSGKGGRYVAKKPKLVTSQSEIEDYLMGLVEEGDLHDDPAATYYFIVTKDPSNLAVDSLLNRLWGKATQSVDLSNKDGT